MGKRTVLWVGGSLVLGWAVWMLLAGWARHPGREPPGTGLSKDADRAAVEASAHAGSVRDASARDRSGPDAASPADAAGKREAATSTLVLHVRGPNGKPLAGTLRWRTTPRAPVTSDALLPTPAGATPGAAGVDGVQQQSHEGELRLEIPRRHWTWLRASAGRSLVARSAYLLVPPFRGTREEELRLDPARRAIHVFVLEPDLAKPMAKAAVRLFAVDMRRGGPAVALRRQRTDAQGYVAFKGLKSGGYLVCAPGAAPEDAPPTTVRLMLPQGMAPTELPCTLVATGERARVGLRITARWEARSARPVRLLLVRRDDGSATVQPVVQALRAGSSLIEVKLPPGTYEAVALPLGAVVLRGSQTLLHVRAEGSGGKQVFPIELRMREAKTELVLLGLARQDFPVTVDPRPAHGILSAPEFMYCGRYRWFEATQKIAAPSGRRRMIVHGRGRVWIARRAGELRPGRVEVALEPGCEVIVQWFPKDLRSARGAVVEISSRAGTVVRSLGARLLVTGGAMRPGLSAKLVVPQGPVSLRGQSPSGETWTRRIKAQGPSVTVSVAGL